MYSKHMLCDSTISLVTVIFKDHMYVKRRARRIVHTFISKKGSHHFGHGNGRITDFTWSLLFSPSEHPVSNSGAVGAMREKSLIFKNKTKLASTYLSCWVPSPSGRYSFNSLPSALGSHFPTPWASSISQLHVILLDMTFPSTLPTVFSFKDHLKLTQYHEPSSPCQLEG